MNNSTQRYKIIAFLEGGAVMSTEMLCGKWLSAIFGASLYVWTAVLSVTLLCLTMGYFLGGVLSQKNDLTRLLLVCLLSGGIGIAAMPILLSVLLPYTTYAPLLVAVFITTFALFLIPLTAFGATTPILIQILSATEHNADGKHTGNIYAISTLGGVISTYIIGFWVIENYGVLPPLLATSIGVILLCLLLFSKISFQLKYVYILYAIVLITYWVAYNPIWTSNGNATILYNSDGLMGNLRVVDYGQEGIKMRQLLNNNSAQSTIYKGDLLINSKMPYVHTIATMASVYPSQSKVLLIGLAAGTLVAEFQRLGFEIDIVDIDPRTLYVAKKYFYMDEKNTQFFADDGRHYINVCTEKYDLIVIDISLADTQPHYLYSKECFERIKQLLTLQGALMINFIDYVQYPDNVATRSVLKTCQSVGMKTQLNNQVYKGKNLENQIHTYIQEQIIIAGNDQIPNFTHIDKTKVNACCLMSGCPIGIENAEQIAQFQYNDAYMLRDDLPILEKMKQQQDALYRQEKVIQFNKK